MPNSYSSESVYPESKRERQFYAMFGGELLREDKTILDVAKWFDAQVPGAHYRIHEGQSFIATTKSSSLSSGSTIAICLKTPAQPSLCPHMVFDIHASAPFDFDILEGATISGGTELTAFNKNRQSDINSSVSNLLSNPTIDEEGVLIHSTTQSEGFFQGGVIDFDREIILRALTTYVFRLTSRQAANRCYLSLDWYEPSAT